MIKIKLFLILSLFSVVALAQRDQSQQKKPNILFIFADDQTYTTLSALEGYPVKTPNLDRLAVQGVRFSQTYNIGSFAPAANKVRLYDIISDPQEIHDLAEAQPKPMKLLKNLFKEYGQLQKQMDDPIDITVALNNFMNGVPVPLFNKYI